MKTTHLIALCALASSPILQAEQPTAWWSFDTINGAGPYSKSIHEPVAKVHDEATGFPTLAEGVSGNALKLDGLATHLIRKADKAPALGEAFSFEGWVAL
ncbi:MAG: hypothetical protein ACO3XN_08530, partial [Chthoniobacterales bacterium]